MFRATLVLPFLSVSLAQKPAEQLNTQCLLFNGLGCEAISGEQECLNSRDGRFFEFLDGRRIRGEPCVWCGGGNCPGIEAKCATYETVVGNPQHPQLPEKFEVANCWDYRSIEDTINKVPGYSAYAASAAPFVAVNSGESQACRGMTESDKGKEGMIYGSQQWSYVIWTATSLDHCKALCGKECVAVEFNADNKYCEAWLDLVETSQTVSGYQCYAKKMDCLTPVVEGCGAMTTKTDCLHSKDGRENLAFSQTGLGVYQSPCVWCEDGQCHNRSPARCQPLSLLIRGYGRAYDTFLSRKDFEIATCETAYKTYPDTETSPPEASPWSVPAITPAGGSAASTEAANAAADAAHDVVLESANSANKAAAAAATAATAALSSAGAAAAGSAGDSLSNQMSGLAGGVGQAAGDAYGQATQAANGLAVQAGQAGGDAYDQAAQAAQAAHAAEAHADQAAKDASAQAEQAAHAAAGHANQAARDASAEAAQAAHAAAGHAGQAVNDAFATAANGFNSAAGLATQAAGDASQTASDVASQAGQSAEDATSSASQTANDIAEAAAATAADVNEVLGDATPDIDESAAQAADAVDGAIAAGAGVATQAKDAGSSIVDTANGNVAQSSVGGPGVEFQKEPVAAGSSMSEGWGAIASGSGSGSGSADSTGSTGAVDGADSAADAAAAEAKEAAADAAGAMAVAQATPEGVAPAAVAAPSVVAGLAPGASAAAAAGGVAAADAAGAAGSTSKDAGVEGTSDVDGSEAGAGAAGVAGTAGASGGGSSPTQVVPLAVLPTAAPVGGHFVRLLGNDTNPVYWHDSYGLHSLAPGVECTNCGCTENVDLLTKEQFDSIAMSYERFHCVALHPPAPATLTGHKMVPAMGQFVKAKATAAEEQANALVGTEKGPGVGVPADQKYWQDPAGTLHPISSEEPCECCKTNTVRELNADNVAELPLGAQFSCDMIGAIAVPVALAKPGDLGVTPVAKGSTGVATGDAQRDHPAPLGWLIFFLLIAVMIGLLMILCLKLCQSNKRNQKGNSEESKRSMRTLLPCGGAADSDDSSDMEAQEEATKVVKPKKKVTMMDPPEGGSKDPLLGSAPAPSISARSAPAPLPAASIQTAPNFSQGRSVYLGAAAPAAATIRSAPLIVPTSGQVSMAAPMTYATPPMGSSSIGSGSMVMGGQRYLSAPQEPMSLGSGVIPAGGSAVGIGSMGAGAMVAGSMGAVGVGSAAAAAAAASQRMSVFDQIDHNHDGVLSKEEWQKYAFDAMDANHDGQVSPQEWQASGIGSMARH